VSLCWRSSRRKRCAVFRHIFLTALAFGATTASAESAPQCSVRYATRFVTHFADLPDQIQKDILNGGKIADTGQPFEAYDSITDPSLPRRRLVLAGQSGLKWFVWIDHGGFDRHYDVFGFSQIWEKVDVFRWYRNAELQGDPCIAINAFLDGVRTPEQIEK
jgi:hypothetical protein